MLQIENYLFQISLPCTNQIHKFLIKQLIDILQSLYAFTTYFFLVKVQFLKFSYFNSYNLSSEVDLNALLTVCDEANPNFLPIWLLYL